ncbi:chemotaxis protein CheW [Hahella sp. KA22]|uniref:chemotaxis protein CheW n=1 Tax=Hahella sp. KA22 TaxID=1628392 RepID=UPI000FDEE4C3|nr:chemotaxis protein CheW [Hahella sp. KA22]AZZ90064.1 chemotaxis protein CheW [Hahella sp. KA22]QAY53434.1 chemotaxis protein CheW [Hahella sp. KA22]
MVEQTSGQISCLLIPVQGKNLLLPNASIAEIVDYQAPEPVEDGADWLLGYIRWRGLRLPLMSYDKANKSASGAQSAHTRIAVTNTIGDKHKQLPFMAFVTQGLPRLMKVRSEEVSAHEKADLGPMDKMMVKVSGEEAIIPSLEQMELLALQAVSAR